VAAYHVFIVGIQHVSILVTATSGSNQQKHSRNRDAKVLKETPPIHGSLQLMIASSVAIYLQFDFVLSCNFRNRGLRPGLRHDSLSDSTSQPRFFNLGANLSNMTAC
jgi:hypothetical protein